MPDEVPPIVATNVKPKKHITPVRIDEDLMGKIKIYMTEHSLKTISMAIRELIVKGLG